MRLIFDKVGSLGMSESNSTYLDVDAHYVEGQKEKIAIEPPIKVILEGEDARITVAQEGLAARYNDDELRVIGEGSSMLGLKRVIGDIALNGNLEFGATKPLHPNLIDADVVEPMSQLPAPRRELTA